MIRHVRSVLIVVTLAALPALAATPAPEATSPVDGACTPDLLLEDARAALTRGSPALRAYMRALLKDAALVTSNETLLRQLEREDDPALLEALGAALAAKAEMTSNPSLVAPLLKRALQDSDPARRAAAVRALRGTGSVELMSGADAGVDYERLIRDEAPGVREAVVENLVVEDDAVYSGHNPELAEAAFEVADASPDKAAAARIIAETSTENASPERARSLARTLDDSDVALRVASARALGGLPPELAPEAARVLVARYQTDDAVEVRREILTSLARLERVRAIPRLDALRSVDPRLRADIDAWIAVLKLELPEWQLVVREKNRQ